jgi:inhibitor of the pro-sigma K processing machinery
METQMVVYFLVAIAGLFILGRVLTWPFKFLFKLLINSVLGIVLLVITNILGSGFGIEIGLNAITVLVAGFLGVPGVLFLLIFKYFL